MKQFPIFLLSIFFLACSSNKSKENSYPSLPKLVKSVNRSCSNSTAEKFTTKDLMLEDFYAHDQYKDSFELNLSLGCYYYDHKDYDSAFYYDLKALKIDSSQSNIHFDMALDYCELNNFQSALKSINKALDICGDTWEYLNSKCYILGKLDSCNEALKVGRISLQMNPDNRKIYGNLMNCFDKLGQKDSIGRYFDLVIRKFDLTKEKAEELKQKYNYN